MHYLVVAKDKENSEDLRKSVREDHLAWLDGKPIAVGGPFLSDDKSTMIGSLFIIVVDSREAVETLLATDPYVKAKLFQSVEIFPWKWIVGAPE